MSYLGWLVGFYSKLILGLFYAEDVSYFIPLLIGLEGFSSYLLKSAFLLMVRVFKSEYGDLFAGDDVYQSISSQLEANFFFQKVHVIIRILFV